MLTFYVDNLDVNIMSVGNLEVGEITWHRKKYSSRVVRYIFTSVQRDQSRVTRGGFFKKFCSVRAQLELRHNLYTKCDNVILRVVTEL
jgi:hypothetical protein